MRIAAILPFFILLFNNVSFGQGTFQSAGSGNWDAPSSWTLISGSSSTNYPVAGDTANITGSSVIAVDVNSQCNAINLSSGGSLTLNTSTVTLSVSKTLSIASASSLVINQGIVTVTGTLTQNGASTVTINQGALTVVGLMFLNSPTTSAGTTLLDVEGGAFSCAGGMSITATTVPAGRFSELRIGNSAVNIGGGLATISANAKINFTGTGSLTLAGIINIPNTASFIPGNGRVIYFGIPGTDQIIAPLTYYRLLITGVGNGSKKINEIVTVTDTLTLLTDTLIINTGGVLNIGNQVTIVKTAGKLLSPPVFSGVVDVVYNNVVKDTTGAEIPLASSALRNLTINDISGIKLGSNITVNNSVTLQNGALLTDTYNFNITNPNGGVTADPAIQRNNGYVNGTIIRTIGTSTGIRTFPFGISISQGYREFQLNYTTAPTTAGTLTVQHFDSAASNQSGLPLADGSVVISNTAPMYWQADAGAGLAGGAYNLSLTADGTTGITDPNTLRIIKRPSSGGAWTINGTAGTNAGTTTAPVIIRNGMSGFSQFTFGGDNTNTLPVKLLYFSGKLSGKNIDLSWATATENSSNYFEIESGTNGNNFTPIGRVPNITNSSRQTSYAFTDYHAFSGTNYYRLKQVDKDGNFIYSNIISIKMSQLNSLKVYPTITSQQINVITSTNEVIKMYNISGQLVKTLVAGNNNISNLANGIYFITDEQKNIIKIVKE